MFDEVKKQIEWFKEKEKDLSTGVAKVHNIIEAIESVEWTVKNWGCTHHGGRAGVVKRRKAIAEYVDVLIVFFQDDPQTGNGTHHQVYEAVIPRSEHTTKETETEHITKETEHTTKDGLEDWNNTVDDVHWTYPGQGGKDHGRRAFFSTNVQEVTTFRDKKDMRHSVIQKGSEVTLEKMNRETNKIETHKACAARTVLMLRIPRECVENANTRQEMLNEWGCWRNEMDDYKDWDDWNKVQDNKLARSDKMQEWKSNVTEQIIASVNTATASQEGALKIGVCGPMSSTVWNAHSLMTWIWRPILEQLSVPVGQGKKRGLDELASKDESGDGAQEKTKRSHDDEHSSA